LGFWTASLTRGAGCEDRLVGIGGTAVIHGEIEVGMAVKTVSVKSSAFGIGIRQAY
jgi:hypothetical protein